jgi:shikimate dehydrogenase
VASTDDIALIQSCIRNRLDRKLIGKKQIAGIIGDAPSHYAKSPSIWNAAFRALKMNAVYLPFDVDAARLPELVAALKNSDRVMGVNVTVPYKVKIMKHLDELDERAAQIGAVNTTTRRGNGKLVGSNTDGKGFVQSLLAPQAGQVAAFVESLKGTNALIIGAGGSARAVAFHLAEAIGGGQLLICNRTPTIAFSLAEEINKSHGHARPIREEEIADQALKVDLIVNCTIKGQGGIRKSSDGRITTLEPYSALASANPASFPETQAGKAEFYRAWLSASLDDVEANNGASWKLALSIPLNVGFYDLIYFPAETVFLRHGRLSGHRTLNGKGMIVAQAAEAFFHNICRDYLKKTGLSRAETFRRLLEIMERAW